MSDAGRAADDRGFSPPLSRGRIDPSQRDQNRFRRSGADQFDLLRGIVADQVVPRLRNPSGRVANALRSREPLGAFLGRATDAIDDTITSLVDRLLANDVGGARDTIDATCRRGRVIESVYLDLIEPAARRLRQLWREDRAGLAEATLALLDLQSLLHQLAMDADAEYKAKQAGHRVLLATPLHTGEVHAESIGMIIGSEFYRREGWETWIEHDMTSTAFDDTVRHTWFDVVEIFIGAERDLEPLAGRIRAIRAGSRNRALGVIARGQIFSANPDFGRRVGADLTSPDPRASLMMARRLANADTVSDFSFQIPARPVAVPIAASKRRARHRKLRST